MIRHLATVAVLLALCGSAAATGTDSRIAPAAEDPGSAPESIYLLYSSATPLGYFPKKFRRVATPHVVYLRNLSGLGGVFFTMTRERRGKLTVVHNYQLGLGAQQGFIVYGEPGDRFYFRSALVPGRLVLEFEGEEAPAS